MLNNFQAVHFLSMKLPYIRQFSNSIVVIKYGGSAMKNNKLKNQIINDIILLSSLGIKVVVVHGGGHIIDFWLKKLNIEPRFDKGIRITDSQTMEIVEMVLVGKVNKELVALLNTNHSCAVGLSGKDGNLIIASPLFNYSDNFVGKVEAIDKDIINLLLDKGYIPVIASVAADIHGHAYNINADTVASSIAISLKAEKLILLTDTHGIMNDINDPSTLLSHLTVVEVQKLKESNIISGGMIPKVDCCINALNAYVKSAHILDGRVEHALLLEMLTAERIGSMLTL